MEPSGARSWFVVDLVLFRFEFCICIQSIVINVPTLALLPFLSFCIPPSFCLVRIAGDGRLSTRTLGNLSKRARCRCFGVVIHLLVFQVLRIGRIGMRTNISASTMHVTCRSCNQTLSPISSSGTHGVGERLVVWM